MEFIYVLKLIDRLVLQENWTKEDEAIVLEHIQHLEALKESGELVIAGKTSGLDEDTFGICIFQAESLEEAAKTMNSDPGIKKGIMTAKLRQYDVAVFNEKYKKKD